MLDEVAGFFTSLFTSSHPSVDVIKEVLETVLLYVTKKMNGGGSGSCFVSDTPIKSISHCFLALFFLLKVLVDAINFTEMFLFQN